jgi:hypothetical protein
MNLWDREILPFESALERLSPAQRLSMAVTALDHTVRTEPSPVHDREAAQWISGAIAAGRTAAAAGATRVTLPDDLDAQYEDLDATVSEAGVPQLMMGIISCADHDELEPTHLTGVLEACFEFAAQRQDPEPKTVEEQEANVRCRELVAYQKSLINQAVA